jgi:hypothetical protein
MDFLRSSIDQRTFRTVPNRLATRRYLDHAWLMRICSNFSVDEPTQTLTCAAVTNVRDVNNIPESQTVVTPLASTQGAPFLSILYPGVVVRGNVQTAGGIILSSKPTP